MLKYSDDFVEKGADDNLLGDNLLGENLLGGNLLDNNLLGDNSSTYINSDINIDSKAKSNLDENVTNDNFQEENSVINIENLF